jgi:hypothetical protein
VQGGGCDGRNRGLGGNGEDIDARFNKNMKMEKRSGERGGFTNDLISSLKCCTFRLDGSSLVGYKSWQLWCDCGCKTSRSSIPGRNVYSFDNLTTGVSTS